MSTSSGKRIIDRLLELSRDEREKFLSTFTEDQLAQFTYDWHSWARPNQLPPDDFQTGKKTKWLFSAGRGAGKTRSGAEWLREQHEQKGYDRTTIVAATAGDARDIMVEGESGILAVCPAWFRPVYEPSKMRLTWPNGSRTTIRSADEPDRFRGIQSTKVWTDEVASWRYPESWDMLMFGLRLGNLPQVVITTTAKRTKLYKQLLKDPSCVVTRGSTYENRQNLAQAFFTEIVSRYEGTTLGRQELHSELIEDVDGAIWKRQDIEKNRVEKAPPLVRVVIPIDPATTSNEGSDETGIIPVGIDENGHGYVLDDQTIKASPQTWASVAIAAYNQWKADRVIGEDNNGGDLIEYTLRTIDRNIPYRKVHASRGKIARAEPIAALYEQGKVHHVGTHAMLEDEMCTWTLGDRSPNRIDSLVWGLSYLMLKGQGAELAFAI